jgi:PTH1 family peptidyl-tRNA hydrolase
MCFLIVGLGNPGPGYRASRHNIGFMVVDRLAQEMGIRLASKRFDAKVGMVQIGQKKVYLLKPQTFMNLSGQAVAPASLFWKISPDRLVVAYDDMDLDLGRIQLRSGGGDGGHRGIRSVIEHLNTPNFSRLRLGVGRPPTEETAVDHVLSPFVEDESDLLHRGTLALKVWLTEGMAVAMNQFNRWKKCSAKDELDNEGQQG